MFPMWRLVAPLVLLLRHVAAFDGDDNYMRQSGMFASISTIEDMLFPESVMMKKLEQYHDRLDKSLQGLKSYLDAWREFNLEADIEDTSSSRERYLNNQKSAIKAKEAELTKLLLKSRGKIQNDRLRGDNALINQGEVTYPDDDDDDSAEEEIQLLEKELNDTRNGYEWLIYEYMENLTEENSSALGQKRQVTPPGRGLQHPVDAYLFMKRLTVKWTSVRDNLMNLQNDTVAVFKELDEQRDRFMFPVSADLHGAAVALVRLQDVYGLNMANLGAGIIPAKASHDNKEIRSMGQLQTWDYIFLGKQSATLQYYNRAIQWFKQAVKASENEQLEGDALEVIPKLRETIEKNEASRLVNKSKKNKKKKKKGGNNIKKKEAKLRRVLTEEEDAAHQKQLCRGDKFLSPEYESTLFCRLERLESPYLLLMPLKMEVLHFSPRIVQYHQFLTDSQINYMVKRAKPVLDHSTHGELNGDQISMIRVSMTGWLTEDTSRDDLLTKVTTKIQEATNMEVSKPEDAEQYQVANYGIGGLYNAHPDFGMAARSNMGDRLGTFLIYLSHVGAGGSTVFTRLGVRATPERGSALFWYNLYTEGTGDELTIHAACPVLYGSKWITTKWIHYNSQFRKRSCGLHPRERFH